MMEAEWNQQLCAELMLEVVEVAVLESRMKICKELILETVISDSWEVLEVNRLMRETKEGGVDRLVRLEDALRMEREDRECTAAMLEEDRCLALYGQLQHPAQPVHEHDHASEWTKDCQAGQLLLAG